MMPYLVSSRRFSLCCIICFSTNSTVWASGKQAILLLSNTNAGEPEKSRNEMVILHHLVAALFSFIL
jgi:hypothetical protein